MMNDASLITYPAPAGIVEATQYKVEVCPQGSAASTPLFLYPARVNFLRVPDKDLFPETVPFAYFDMQGPVTVTITAQQQIDFVDIRPKSYNIAPEINGNTITFTLTVPKKVTVELNGDLRSALHLFANPIERDIPSPDDPNVLFFGPGIHHAGTIALKSHQTVYLAGGAYVYGIIRGDGAHHTCVRGRGILSAETTPWPNGSFQVVGCHDLTLRDIILLDSAGWTVKIDDCEDVLVENLKEICCRRNCDGIDLCSTRRAVVKDCFVRNWDDALCIKGLNRGNAACDITFTDCVLWSDAAQSIEIGYETRVERIERVLVKNIDILHHLMPGYMCITVHNGDRAFISDLRFEDIRIEDSVAPVFDVWVGKANWNRDEERGHIHGVIFKNISLMGGTNPASTHQYGSVPGGDVLQSLAAPTARIAGADADHRVEDVTFENVNLLGRYLSNPADGEFQINEFVRNVRFLPPTDGSPVIQYQVEPAEAALAPATVSFDASASFGQAANLTTYAWTFGDGAQADGPLVSHSYTLPGNYTVTITVTDELGRRAQLQRIISVLPAYHPVQLEKPASGLRYRYAEGDFNFGSPLTAIQPIREGITPGLVSPNRSRHDYHALVYTGFIQVPVDGVYRFFAGMEFSTGYDMLAGGSIRVHNQRLSAHNSGWGQIGLKAGFHPIQITRFTKTAGKQVTFQYIGPGIPAQEIPAAVLFYEENDR